jgi:flavodoxin I
MNVKIIYGSDTGNTDYVIETYLLNELSIHFKEVSHLNIYNIEAADWSDDVLFIIGVPTWYDGELQSDWDSYLDEFKKLDFKGKTFAMFGLGDQIGYGEYFVDGIGILAEVILKNGGEIIGFWPTEDYKFSASKALVNDHLFYGLAIDEDNEDEQTYDRVKSWVALLDEICRSKA